MINPLTIMSQLRAAGVGLLLALIIGGAVGGWLHIKKVTELKTEHTIEMNSVRSQLWWSQEANKNLGTLLAQREKDKEERREIREDVSKNIKEARSEDTTVADYLALPVPVRLQQEIHSAACSLLPYSCTPTGKDNAPANEPRNK